jgi:hypothetical protein
MDQQTLAERGIKILDENIYFFKLTKHNYSKYVERTKVWKQIGETKEAWASKVGIITLLAIEWKELNNDALIEFCDQRFEIYFGRWNIVYVISK